MLEAIAGVARGGLVLFLFIFLGLRVIVVGSSVARVPAVIW